MGKTTKAPGLALSLTPCAMLVGLLVLNVRVFGDGSSSGPNQMALLLSAMAAAALAHYTLDYDYRDIERRAIRSILLAMEAIIILMIVGALIGLWIVSGVVPSMIYYGIEVLHPSVFLVVACVLCSVVSLAIGSSWSTVGTVGIALIGIGQALGFPAPLVAGAILSGAYFGDKMSPLSDTTNLAPAVAGSDLFVHIKHMLYTTVPAYTITLVLFGGIGLFYEPGEFSGSEVSATSETLRTAFSIHGYLLVIPLAVIVLAARRMPAIPALVLGGLLGAGAALVFQPDQFAGEGGAFSWTEAYRHLLYITYNGYTMDSGNEIVDGLLSRGGMSGMWSTISLIIAAMLFGGVMEATGMLQRMAQAILSGVRGTGSLVGATVGTSILFNIFAAEQYISIVIPGRMYSKAYEERNLDPRNLSRALEDGGTVTSVLVPWNTCGAFSSSILHVPTLAYAPFCFFNILCPLVSVFLASMGMTIVKKAAEQEDAPSS